MVSPITKNFQTRLDEITEILELESETTINIRSTWAYFLELCMEPTGWQAEWRIPRVTCEKLKVNYPTIVLGIIESVIFNELKCTFRIIGVEEDELDLADIYKVSIEDLWVTKSQLNNELNWEKTAECIDKFRFFYNNIWMPWDDDNESGTEWAEKHLFLRLKFAFDLNSKKIDSRMSSHIRLLLEEARYIFHKKEYIELNLNENESDHDHHGNIEKRDKNFGHDLLKIHLRMSAIKDEISIILNPKMRNMYNDILFKSVKGLKENTNNLLVLKSDCKLEQQIQLLEDVKKLTQPSIIFKFCSTLDEALKIANRSDKIYLPPGEHAIKFYEKLCNNGSLECIDSNSNATIKSKQNEIILFKFDGNYKISNVTFDCSNVSMGLTIRNSSVILEKCKFINTSKSINKQAITLQDNATVILKNTKIENFLVGILLKKNSTVQITESSSIIKCTNGIETEDGCKIYLDNCEISQSKYFAILIKTLTNSTQTEKMKIYNKTENIKNYGDVTHVKNLVFKENLKGNIAILNQNKYIGESVDIKTIKEEDLKFEIF